ncbi:ATP-binding protein, partial [Streptomyces angustmyceticus]
MATAVQTAPYASPRPVPEAQGTALVGRTPLVGRERELAVALHCLSRQARGGGIWITGEPGVGKTRLAQEVVAASQAAPRGARPLLAVDPGERPGAGDLPYEPRAGAGG